MNPFTRITVTVAVFTAAAAHAQVAATLAYDVVIRHGKVLDAADVAIKDGRFVTKVASCSTEAFTNVIDHRRARSAACVHPAA